jgi:sulfite exporter TauE/SafE/copper chaperone CopZ
MRCASCETLISEVLKKIPGVEEVEVSLKKKKAGVRLSDGSAAPDLGALNAALAAHGYVIGEVPHACALPSARPWSQRAWSASVALAVIAAVWMFLLDPLREALPQAPSGASLIALFGLGVLASVSTCLASTGAFFLAAGSRLGMASGPWMHAGRLFGFALGGAALGALSGALPSSPYVYGAFGLLLGAGFFMVGLSLLDLAPSLASFGIRMPHGVTQFADRVGRERGAVAAFFAGIVSFMLPCGFTQTAQALALASGSAVRGAAFMLAFALGTLPVLYGATAFGARSVVRSPWMKLAAGAMLVLFGIGQVDGGLTVLGSSVTVSGVLARVTAPVVGLFAATPVQAQEQLISMKVVGGTFSPSRFTVKRGVPVRWSIEGIDISGCVSTIVAPTIGVKKDLVKGSNEVLFTPKEEGTIPFSCSMGMVRGSFTVVE